MLLATSEWQQNTNICSKVSLSLFRLQQGTTFYVCWWILINRLMYTNINVSIFYLPHPLCVLFLDIIHKKRRMCIWQLQPHIVRPQQYPLECCPVQTSQRIPGNKCNCDREAGSPRRQIYRGCIESKKNILRVSNSRGRVSTLPLNHPST